MNKDTLTKNALSRFTGTERWYRHGLACDVLFTDGAKYVADQGGAYWLLDAIALAQRGDQRVAAAAFQLWTLTVRPDRTATLTCVDGNCNPVFRKDLAYTDFPLDEVKLYFTDNVILLPSEY